MDKLNELLLEAALNGETDTLHRLLTEGADINARDEDGRSALMIAATENNLEMLELLLDAGADINARDENGFTALIDPVAAGYIGIVNALLARNIDVNAQSNDGWTALMMAASADHLDIVSTLLAHGAQVNDQNNNEETALKMAIDEGHTEIIRALTPAASPVEDRYELTEGPLPKSLYTNQLEDITRKLLMNTDFEFIKKQDEDYVQFLDGAEFSWTDIIQYANLDHIELNEHDFLKYKQYIKQCEQNPYLKKNGPTLDEDLEASYKEQLYSDYHTKNLPLPARPISFQEMQAINVYSGPNLFEKMNYLLKGKFDFQNHTKDIIKAIIIQSIMCASGLRKVPEITIPEVYRGANVHTPEELDNYIKTAKQQGVIQLSGFVSSSTNKEIVDVRYQSKPVVFHFTHLKGVYIAPISKSKDENEFLIPPTQVQLTDYKKVNDKHCFEGRLVSDLASVKARSLEMGSPPDTKVITKQYRQALKLIDENAVPDLKSEDKKAVEDSTAKENIKPTNGFNHN